MQKSPLKTIANAVIRVAAVADNFSRIYDLVLVNYS